VGHEKVNQVFDSLDIPRDTQDELPIISPKNYSSIFRVLYLSSYLKADDSNEILTTLTKTPFNNKLVAGVPREIRVSHKIGVFQEKQSKNSIYSDCGIFFIPKRPYILCVMYKGDENIADQHMKNVSKLIYSFVSDVKPK
jgi:hypothetical protein